MCIRDRKMAAWQLWDRASRRWRQKRRPETSRGAWRVRKASTSQRRRPRAESTRPRAAQCTRNQTPLRRNEWRSRTTRHRRTPSIAQAMDVRRQTNKKPLLQMRTRAAIPLPKEDQREQQPNPVARRSPQGRPRRRSRVKLQMKMRPRCPANATP